MRDYQLTVYGATGFTGKIACAYIHKQYGSTIKWAIAGRSKAKLDDLSTELDGIPGILIADGNDERALSEIAIKSDVVATCAGPFSRYGSNLVKCCAEQGTHYCDITGESDWVREMIVKYDDLARSTGSRIVHMCGHDSVPWDLSSMMLAKKIERKE